MDHHNIASTLSWHGLRAESDYVLRMGEQRAELLEALKSVQRWLDEEWEEYPFEVAVRFAINRAEAAE